MQCVVPVISRTQACACARTCLHADAHAHARHTQTVCSAACTMPRVTYLHDVHHCVRRDAAAGQRNDITIRGPSREAVSAAYVRTAQTIEAAMTSRWARESGRGGRMPAPHRSLKSASLLGHIMVGYVSPLV